jgi:2-C-methyl-D-erythritol 4-phosphate cytidylyltransferase
VSEPGVVVIIPAAGSGSRFGSDLPKQFHSLGDRTILQRVIERFLYDERVELVVVPVHERGLANLAEQATGRRVQFVAGGETRQESVARGFEAADMTRGIVAVHDAVRPFFSYEVFHAVIEAARAYGAAFPALPLADTIHVLDNNQIVDTPDRSKLVAAQTPQCFRADVLRDVLSRGGGDATDEAGLAAKYGYVVKAVPGDSLNFKITRPEDLVMAERVLAEWGPK